MQVSKPKNGYKLVDVGSGKKIEVPEEWEISELKSQFLLKQGRYFDKTLVKPGKFAVFGANGIIIRKRCFKALWQ